MRWKCPPSTVTPALVRWKWTAGKPYSKISMTLLIRFFFDIGFHRKTPIYWTVLHTNLQKKCITLVDLQLDAQNSNLFTYNTFIKILYMFRALPCSFSRGLRRNCIYAASGIVTVCRWQSCAPVKKELQFFLNRCTGQSPGGLRRNCIYAASGIVTLCSWLSWAPVKKERSLLTGAQDSHLQTVTIPEAAYIQLRRGPPADEQGNARNIERILINILYINK
jgi:hypothetical protein